MRRRRLIHAVVLAGVIAGIAPAIADAQGGGGRTGRRPPQLPRPNVQEKAFEWSGEVASGQQLIVRSLNGSIRVEPSTGTTLEIVASKLYRRGQPESVKIEATRVNDGVLVCARWPGTTVCDESSYRSSGSENSLNEVRVNFAIRLPAGVSATIHTTNGDIAVAGASGDLRAFTTNGNIRLGTTATVSRAETTSGDVRVQMAKLPPREGRYASVTSGVFVTLPDGINANVDASTTTGSFSSDFAIAVQGAFSPKRLRGTIGTGGPVLILQSVRGNVRLLKQ